MMPDQQTDPTGAGHTVPTVSASTSPTTSPMLAGLLAEAIVGIDGVVRLQPTLSTDGPRILVRNAATDGLHLLHRAGKVDVDVNVITDNAHQARSLAHQISRRTADLISTHELKPGAVTVNVLALEASSTTPIHA